MNRKRMLRITLIVVLVLLLSALWTALQGGPLARGYTGLLFQWNRPAFDFAAVQAVERESGRGVSHPLGVWDVQFWDGEEAVVDFVLGSYGLGAATCYWGLQYVPSGAMLGYQGAVLEGWTPDGNGWRWEERGGDNRCYLQQLAQNWYYYEMYF